MTNNHTPDNVAAPVSASPTMSVPESIPAKRQPMSTPAKPVAPLKSGIIKGMLSLMSPGGRGGRLSLMLFHKIPRHADPLTPRELTLDRIEPLLDFFAANTHVLPLSEATASLANGTLPRRAVVLTFDDGYSEWVDHIAPALRKRNLPATFFVTTGQLHDGESLWHERITSAVRALPDNNISLPFGFGSYARLGALDQRARLVQALQERLKYVPLRERIDAIAMLEAQARQPLVLPARFDSAAVRALHSQGFEIGAHTVHHPILNESTIAEARDEIGRCKEELEAIIGGPVTSFAYPNGRPGTDFGPEHVEIVKACGYTSALTTSNGVATSSSDMFQLPRFSPWGLADEQVALQLARNVLTPVQTVAPRQADAAAPATDVRCLLIASTFPPIHGGSAVVYDNLCAYMPKGSIRVLTAHQSYMTGKEIEGWRTHDAAKSFPVERIDLLRPRMQPVPANILVSLYRLLSDDLPLFAKVFLRAGRLIRRHRINVICIGELVAGGLLGIALKKVYGCKLVVYVHGEELTTVASGRLYGKWRQQYLQAADKVVAVSSFTCDVLTDQMDIAPDAITLIPNGVDTDRFTPGPRDAELVARHGLEGKKIILTVGRLVERKGIDMTIQAMRDIVARRDDVHYLIVGDGEMRPHLERMIADFGVASHVTLVGKVTDDELLRYLRTCDLFVMPNRTMADGDTEGFGLVFREANACHKPVVGGRAGGAVEAVHDEKSGLLVDGYQPAQIAEAINRILSDPALSQSLADYGLQLARDNNTAAVAYQFLRACERLLMSKRR